MAGGEERVPYLQKHRIEDLKPKQRLVRDTHVPCSFDRSQDHLPIHITMLFWLGKFCQSPAIGKGKRKNRERMRSL